MPSYFADDPVATPAPNAITLSAHFALHGSFRYSGSFQRSLTSLLRLQPRLSKRRPLTLTATLHLRNPILIKAWTLRLSERLALSETRAFTKLLAFTERAILHEQPEVQNQSPRLHPGLDFTATIPQRDLTFVLARTQDASVALTILPAEVDLFTGDTSRPARFRVIEDVTGAAIDLTGTSLQFTLQRRGATAPLFPAALTSALVLPNPKQLMVAIASTGLQSVRVDSTSGLGVGSVVRMGMDSATSEDVTITALDQNHITAVFTFAHAAGDSFDLVPFFVRPTFAASVTASGSPQSVLVSSSAGIVPGNSLRVGIGTPTEGTVTVTAVADSTHFTAIFSQNHASGDLIDYAGPTTSGVYNGRNGYCSYAWPSPSFLTAGVYLGQLRVVFADGSTQHTAPVLFTVARSIQ